MYIGSQVYMCKLFIYKLYKSIVCFNICTLFICILIRMCVHNYISMDIAICTLVHKCTCVHFVR